MCENKSQILVIFSFCQFSGGMDSTVKLWDMSRLFEDSDSEGFSGVIL